MARSATVQFHCFTPDEARAFLASCEKSGDTHGDRLAAARALLPVTTDAERRAARAFAAAFSRRVGATRKCPRRSALHK